MSQSGENPAAIPTNLTDIQGDARWQSLHEDFCHQSREKEANVIFIGNLKLVLKYTQVAYFCCLIMFGLF